MPKTKRPEAESAGPSGSPLILDISAMPAASECDRARAIIVAMSEAFFLKGVECQADGVEHIQNAAKLEQLAEMLPDEDIASVLGMLIREGAVVLQKGPNPDKLTSPGGDA